MDKPLIISRTGLTAVRKLLQKKHREESGKFLVEGTRSVEEAIDSGWPVEMVIVTPEFRTTAEDGTLLQKIGQKHLPLYNISEDDLRKISDTIHAQGIIAVVRQQAWKGMEPRASGLRRIVVALDGVSEPGNMGTIIRTCDWFGVERVLAGRGSVEVFNPKVVRSSMGSVFHVPVSSEIDLAAELGSLKSAGFVLWTTDVEGGAGFGRVQGAEGIVLALGNETRGVSGEIMRLADARISIPRFGKADSLNVAMACGVILGFVRMAAQRGS